jgi:ABC-2 type transport system ATP-binding protein
VLDEEYFYDELTLKEMKNIIAPSYTDWDEPVFQDYIKPFTLNLKTENFYLIQRDQMKFESSLDWNIYLNVNMLK